MDRFKTDVLIEGKDPSEYMADLIEKLEKSEIEIERAKAVNNTLKQMNNRSRTLLDVAKYELKERLEMAAITKQQKETCETKQE